jgi:hypothetical protein
MIRRPLLEHLEHFRWRVLQDALAEATAEYWTRRATAFAAVGTPACDRLARNCRFHAQLLRETGLDAEARELIAAALAKRDRQEVA